MSYSQEKSFLFLSFWDPDMKNFPLFPQIIHQVKITHYIFPNYSSSKNFHAEISASRHKNEFIYLFFYKVNLDERLCDSYIRWIEVLLQMTETTLEKAEISQGVVWIQEAQIKDNDPVLHGCVGSDMISHDIRDWGTFSLFCIENLIC